MIALKSLQSNMGWGWGDRKDCNTGQSRNPAQLRVKLTVTGVDREEPGMKAGRLRV